MELIASVFGDGIYHTTHGSPVLGIESPRYYLKVLNSFLFHIYYFAGIIKGFGYLNTIQKVADF